MANVPGRPLSSGSAFWIIFRPTRLLISWLVILRWRGVSGSRVRLWGSFPSLAGQGAVSEEARAQNRSPGRGPRGSRTGVLVREEFQPLGYSLWFPPTVAHEVLHSVSKTRQIVFFKD